jgi:hypothetical protein
MAAPSDMSTTIARSHACARAEDFRRVQPALHDENENENMIETNAISARVNELSGRVASLRRYL